MPARVTLTVIQGDLSGRDFVFSEATSCIVGRAQDCYPQLPNDQGHRTISRHHCLLDINPPEIRVRDFGSLNGTSVNGAKIGQREAGQIPEEGARLTFPQHDLSGGDDIKLGDTVFRVGIQAPALCAECAQEIPEHEKARAQRLPGIYQCHACRRTAEREGRKEPPKKKPRRCVGCGKDVSREAGDARAGDFVCSTCRGDPAEVVRLLLKLANDGHEELGALRGYRVVGELGQGGMGAVYLARHDTKSRQAALKVMLPQVTANERAKALFLREVNNMKALRHPHLVRLHSHGSWYGIFFFMMDYCDRGDVVRLMCRRGGTLPLDEAVDIVYQALDGLDYAHRANIDVELPDGRIENRRGLVHRDVSPSNILLAGPQAKLADFGLAKAFEIAGLSGLTRTGNAAGKPYFMPRQQVVNFKHARPEVDVWATAACLYNMLTGRYPRDFPRNKDVWQTVLQSDPVPIRKRDPSIPKKLAEVIDLALIDRPQIYFKMAGQLRSALEEVF